MGAANLMAGFFRGFAVSTSGSRTAVAEQSGAKSQVAGLVGAGGVALLLVFFSSLLADLPQSALAAVVITAALSLVDIRAVVHFLRVRPSAFLLSLVASAGVIFFGVLEGIVVAIALGDPVLLPAELVAARCRARPSRRCPRLAQHRRQPGRSRTRGHRDLPVGSAAVLRERGRLPPPGPRLGARTEASLDRPPVRSDHRHRRDRGRDARATRRRAERRSE